VSENPENQPADAAVEDVEVAELTDGSAATEVEEEESVDVPADVPVVVPSIVPIAVDRPVQTVGRRKEAIVRVRLVSGTGNFTLNGRSLDNYFPNKVHQQIVREPLVTLERGEIYDIHASLKGGGVTGQAGALRLAIARALIELDEADRPALKKAGFLTRDARAKERKKYGLKKARKAPQYSKR
jgi:small subunit ribosomal protein S9